MEAHDARLLADAATLEIDDIAIRWHGTTRMAPYRRRGMRCAVVQTADGPAEHVALVPGALRAPFILARGPRGPEWFAGRDVAIASWLNRHPELAPLVALPWGFAGGWFPWLIQARADGAGTLVVVQTDGSSSMGLATAARAFDAIARILPRGPTFARQTLLAEGAFTRSALELLATSQGGATMRGGLSLEDAGSLQRAVQAQISVPAGSVSEGINRAANLLTSRKFAESIAAYEQIAVDFPDRAGTAASQIGAALYFLGRYEEAIAHYRRAVDLGEDREMMHMNIAEAEEALQKRRR